MMVIKEKTYNPGNLSRKLNWKHHPFSCWKTPELVPARPFLAHSDQVSSLYWDETPCKLYSCYLFPFKARIKAKEQARQCSCLSVWKYSFSTLLDIRKIHEDSSISVASKCDVLWIMEIVVMWFILLTVLVLQYLNRFTIFWSYSRCHEECIKWKKR